MIKSLGIILLAVYCFNVFRIVIPLIDYSVNFNYIVSQLCEQKDDLDNTCRGKCHLSKKLQKQTEKAEKSKSVVQLDFVKIPHQLLINLKLDEPNRSELLLYFHFNTDLIQQLIRPVLPPPRGSISIMS